MDELENRYPALYEFRRANWPHFENLKNKPQDIGGFLDDVIRPDFGRFSALVQERSGNHVKIIQRVDQPPTQELDKDFLKDFETLIVVSLDHDKTNQTATQGEIDSVKDFLGREDHCVFVCPHHKIGSPVGPADDPKKVLEDQTAEWEHHQDRTIPGRQEIGGFARSLLKGLGFDVENRWGLNPQAEEDGSPSPILKYSDVDTAKILDGVTTLNLHAHLPHLNFTPRAGVEIDVLARQRINPRAKRHPFVPPDFTAFNALLSLRAPGRWPGCLYVGDATLWSRAFGGLRSLERLWLNLADMR